jgi:hypothetical protein
MLHEHVEALGALVRPAAFKAVESWCKPTLVGSIPMRFRSTLDRADDLWYPYKTRARPSVLPDAQRGEGKT